MIMPSGSVVPTTVVSHADVNRHPYGVEEFRDALARLNLLNQVTGFGAYQMNHVCAVPFNIPEDKKGMLTTL